MTEAEGQGICARLAEIRTQNYGPRGKSRFARELGIGSSTYDRYERDRMPPADLLMNAARLTGTRIEWLITGDGIPDAVTTPDTGRSAELANRLRRLLHRRPDLADHVGSFLDLLAQQVDAIAISKPVRQADWQTLVPVVGSTAAGPAHFWQEVDSSAGGPDADARLEEILSTYADRSIQSAGEMRTAQSMTPSDEPSSNVALIQLSRPDELGFLEFLSGTSIKEKNPAAIAWRIDGDSMSPRYEDGDFVITSPDQPAISGQPCVARQRGQIGVNCKLFHERGSEVILIPVNEQRAVQAFPSTQLEWAYRVLYSVRLH